MELFVSFIYQRNSVINQLKVGEKTKLSKKLRSIMLFRALIVSLFFLTM